MNKRILKLSRQISFTAATVAIFGLITSLVFPILAQGAETITKTFQVISSDGTNLAGAKVQIFWSSSSNPTIQKSAIATTDANGSASIVIDKGVGDGSVDYQIMPASNDLLNATPPTRQLLDDITETTIVKLEVPNLFLNIDIESRLASGATTFLKYPEYENGAGPRLYVIRSGKFGIALSSKLPEKTYSGFSGIGLQNLLYNHAPNQFLSYFNLVISSANGTRTYSVTGSGSSVDGSGTYTIAYSEGNFFGQLTFPVPTPDPSASPSASPTPSPFTFGKIGDDFVVGTVGFETSLSGYSLSETNAVDGKWYARIPAPTPSAAATLKGIVNISGSHEYPIFPITVYRNTEGNYSLQVDGTPQPVSSASPLTIPLPAASDINLKLLLKDTSSSTSGKTIDYTLKNKAIPTQITGGTAFNGKLSAVLPQGDYSLLLRTVDGSFVDNEYTISVLENKSALVCGGELSACLSDSATKITPDASSIYTLTLGVPNVKIRFKDGESVIGATVEVYSGQTYVTNSFVGTLGYVGFKLADGTYRVAISPRESTYKYVSREYELTVAGGVASTTGATEIGGVLEVQLDKNNLRYKVSTFGNTEVRACPTNNDFSDKNTNDCIGDWADIQGMGGLKLNNGKYWLQVIPRGDSTKAKKSYQLTVATSTATITGVTPAGTGVFSLAANSTNLTGVVKAGTPISQPISGIRVNCSVWNGEYWDGCKDADGFWVEGAETDYLGRYGFALPGAASPGKKYRFEYRSNSGNLGDTVSGEISYVSGDQVIPEVVLNSGNVKVEVAYSEPFEGSDVWVEVFISTPDASENYDVNSTWFLGSSARSDKTAYFTVPTTLDGKTPKVRIRVNKANWSNNSNLNGVTKVETEWLSLPANPKVTLTKGNLSGMIKLSDGSAVLPGPNKWVHIQVQKATVVNSELQWNWTPQYTNPDSSGNYSLSITEQGIYRIVAYPNGYANATTTNSECIYVSSDNKLQVGACATPAPGDGYNTSASLNLVLASPNVSGKIVKASDGSAVGNTNSGWIYLEVQRWVTAQGGNGYWDGNGGGGNNVAANGDFAVSIPNPGKYRLMARPERIGGVATGYSSCFEIEEGSKKIVTTDCTTAAVFTSATTSLAGLQIALPAPIISGKVRFNDKNVAFTWVELLKPRAEGGYDWIEGTVTDSAGDFSFSVNSAGTYAVRVNPPWNNADPSSSSKIHFITVAEVSSKLTCTSANCGGNFDLGQANVIGRVTKADGSAIVPSNNVSVNVSPQKWNGSYWQWQEGTNIGQDSTYKLSLGEGTFKLRIMPNGIEGASSVDTDCFVVKSNGEVSATYPCAETASTTFSSQLRVNASLGAANFFGILQDGGSPAPYTWIEVRQILSDGSENFDTPGSSTGANGKFSISITKEGSYRVTAYPPNNSTKAQQTYSVTATKPSGTIVLSVKDSAGAPVAPGGDGYILSLASPNVSGTVKKPDGGSLTLTNGRSVCMNVERYNGSWWEGLPIGTCARSNGQFALNVTGDGTSDYRLRLSLWGLPEYSFGSTESFKTFPQSLEIKLNNPNLQILAKADLGDSLGIANTWIEIREDKGSYFEWLGGTNTDISGNTSFNLPGGASGKRYQLVVNPPWNNPGLGAQNTYIVDVNNSGLASINAVGNPPFATANDGKTLIVSLAAPNLKGIISNLKSQLWMEVLNQDYQWQKGTSVNPTDKRFSLKLDNTTGENFWLIRLNPGPADLASGLGLSTYQATVNGGTVTLRLLDASGTPVGSNLTPGGDGSYTLSLASASLTGTVVGVDGVTGVRDSWVVPIDVNTGEEFWRLGAGSREGGNFALVLKDGAYKLVARAPWNSSGAAASQACTINIQGGKPVASGSTCQLDANDKVQLNLRSPNLSITIKNSSNQTLPNSNVWIQVGNWGSGSNTDSNGKANFLIDPAEIRSLNPGSTSTDQLSMRFYVNPPWGSEYSGTFTSSGSKDALDVTIPTVFGSSFASTNLTLQVGNPNTVITVKKGASTVTNAFVEIFKVVGNSIEWVQGNPTSSDGKARFNLATDGTKYKIRVWPAPADRATYSDAWIGGDSGLSQSELANYEVPLVAANAVGTVTLPSSGGANSYGWIGIEECDNSYSVCNYVNGVGLDRDGKYATTLTSGKYYRITAYPGPGKVGAPTKIQFQMTSDLVVTKDIVLESGNVRGTVTGESNAPIEGVIMTATLVGGSTSFTTTTDSAGKYGFQLDFSGGKQWLIKAIPPKDQVALTVKTLTVTGDNSSADLNLV